MHVDMAKPDTGVKVQVYDTDPGSILIVCAHFIHHTSMESVPATVPLNPARNQEPMNNLKIREFVLAQPHVDYYVL